jgi:hypothetical protein
MDAPGCIIIRSYWFTSKARFLSCEPLLVIESDQNGKYIVIVGNRRLADCKILNNPELANVRQTRIKNIIEDLSRDNIPYTVPAFLFDKREDILEDLDYNPGPLLARRWF